MSRWQSHIDQILGDARARAAGLDPATGAKVASANRSVLDSARETADALDFVANHDPMGQAIGHFFVEKAALAPPVSGASAKGEQAEPPRQTSLPAAPATGGSRPAVSSAPGGAMPVMPISQSGGKAAAPAAPTKAAGWTPLANGPQDDPTSWSAGNWNPASAKVAEHAQGTTLFDIVMQGRTAAKEAASPVEYVGGEDSGAAPAANEGSLTRFLASNEAAVAYTKRDAKEPTRARIGEVFKNVNDPANPAAVDAAFPQAAAKGGLKIAGKSSSLTDFLAGR